MTPEWAERSVFDQLASLCRWVEIMRVRELDPGRANRLLSLARAIRAGASAAVAVIDEVPR